MLIAVELQQDITDQYHASHERKLYHIGSKCGNINPSLYLQMKNADNLV